MIPAEIKRRSLVLQDRIGPQLNGEDPRVAADALLNLCVQALEVAGYTFESTSELISRSLARGFCKHEECRKGRGCGGVS